jgi:hypothetical protein
MATSAHGFLSGVLITVAGQSLIGLAFAIKRWISQRDTTSSKSFFSRLYDWRFWISSGLLLLGEACNFIGYLFMPAHVMVILGAIGLVVAQIASAIFLSEYISSVHISGTLVIVAGAALVLGMTPTLPSEYQITSFNDASVRWMDSVPLVIITSSVVVISVLITLVAKIQRIRNNERIRNHSMQVPQTELLLIIYALTGSLSVITTKGVGLLVKELVIDHKTHFHNAVAYLIWPWWFALIFSIVLMINWLLHHNELSSISPVMYAMYAIAGSFSSLIYYREIGSHTAPQLILTVFGFLMLLIGVWMITRVYPRSMGFWPWCSPKFPRVVTRHDDLPDEPPVDITYGDTSSMAASSSMTVSTLPREEVRFLPKSSSSSSAGKD